MRALEQAVLVLGADEGRQVLRLGDPLGLGDLPAGVVAAADVAHLAGAHHVVQRAQRLFDRRAVVGQVHLVEVDVVGVEAAQAGVERVHEVLARGAAPVRAFAHGAGGLRGDDDVAAVGLEVRRQELLRLAAAVDVGGIEEGDAQVDALVDDVAGALCVDAPAEVVAAEADGRNMRPELPRLRYSTLRVPFCEAVSCQSSAIGRGRAGASESCGDGDDGACATRRWRLYSATDYDKKSRVSCHT